MDGGADDVGSVKKRGTTDGGDGEFLRMDGMTTARETWNYSAL